MAINASHLLPPPDGSGELSVELLTALDPRAVDAEAVASAYADEANVRVAEWEGHELSDAAATAWAHYRALSVRSQQINTGMQQAAVAGEVSRAYSPKQAEQLQDRADYWLGIFTGLEREVFPTTGAQSGPPNRSRLYRTIAKWH